MKSLTAFLVLVFVSSGSLLASQLDVVSNEGPPVAHVSAESTASSPVESLLGYPVRTDHSNGIEVRMHYSGHPSSVFGDNLAFELPMPVGSDMVSIIKNFLGAHYDVFGVDPINLELKATTNVNANTLFRFEQTIDGIPVIGADTIVTIKDSVITRINSNYVKGAFSLGTISSSNALDGVDSILLALFGDFTFADFPAFVYYINQPAKSFKAEPRVEIHIRDGRGVPYTAYFDAASGYLIDIVGPGKDITDAYVNLRTRVMRVNYPSLDCDDDGDCTSSLCGELCNICQPQYYTGESKCVKACSQSSDCANLTQNTVSCDANDGYCIEGQGPWGMPLIYSGHYDNWGDTDYQNEAAFYLGKESMEHWRAFIYDELGRASWDDNNGQLNLSFNCPSCGNSMGANGFIWLNSNDAASRFYIFKSQDETTRRQRAHLIGHEGAHSVDQSIEAFSFGCMNEGIAQIYGSMFGRSEVPGTWNAGAHVYSGWYDDVNGLNSSEEYPLNYAHRSRFDWLPCDGIPQTNGTCTTNDDCLPYLSCESGTCTEVVSPYHSRWIWSRFLRLLGEGSSSLARDGYGESYGVSFNGVGDATTYDIVYDAHLHADYFTDPVDLAGLLIEAGTAIGSVEGSSVRYALGAAGFPSERSSLSLVTDQTPRKIYFPAWSASGEKDFTIWKDGYSSNIKVMYHNGTSWVTSSFAANTDTSPVVAIHNDRLHIFWRDQSSGAIYVRYYTGAGYIYGNYSLAINVGLYVDGAFDAVKFNGALYLGFVRPGDDSLSLARCVATSYGCTGARSDWHDYSGGGGVYYRDIGSAYAATGNGVALAASNSVEGAPSGEYLYALLTNPFSGAYNGRLKVVMLNTADSFVTYRWLPMYYDSWKADLDAPRGLQIRTSSYAAQGKYLYLAWNDKESDEIFVSIMRDWEYDSGHTWWDRAWFTYSVGIGETALTGVSLRRADNSLMSVYNFADGTYSGRETKIYTRY